MLLALTASLLTAAPALHARKTTLPNGLTVILAEDHRVPGVAVELRYGVGSRDEAPGRTGFAHLFEHLMFMGSKHAPYPFFDTSMAQHGGSNNADTGNDRTRYYEWGPSNLLHLFLWLEADRLATLPDVMTDEKVNAQRLIVLNERREDYDNRPYGATEVAVCENLFPANHPYHWPVLGYPNDLASASTADVVAFFKRFYTPSNASLAIVGDFDSQQALAWVNDLFAWMPSHPVERAHAAPVSLEKTVTLDLDDDVELPKAVLAWHSPAEATDGDAAFDVLGRILAGNRSSRLHRALVYEQRIAQDVSADQQSLALGSVFQVELLATPGNSAQKLIDSFDVELQKLAHDGPTQAELDAALLAQRTSIADSIEPLGARATLMNLLFVDFGDPNAIDRDWARYEKLTPDSIRAAAAQLVQQQRVVIRFHPKKVEP